MSQTTNMIVRGIPPRLKGKIAKRVADRKSSLNDVLVGILADHFGVAFSPSGRTAAAEINEHPNPVLRVPVELKRRIDVEAATRGESIRNVVVEIFADAFDEPFVPTGRWRGHVKRSTTAAA
jgi:hypothetical protein